MECPFPPRRPDDERSVTGDGTKCRRRGSFASGKQSECMETDGYELEGFSRTTKETETSPEERERSSQGQDCSNSQGKTSCGGKPAGEETCPSSLAEKRQMERDRPSPSRRVKEVESNRHAVNDVLTDLRSMFGAARLEDVRWFALCHNMVFTTICWLDVGISLLKLIYCSRCHLGCFLADSVAALSVPL